MEIGPGSQDLDLSSAGFPAARPGSGAATPAPVRRPALRVRVVRAAAPYVLLAPALVVIAAVLAYPLYILVSLSFQQYGLPELIAHEGRWVGLDNYARIVHDSTFWDVVVRTFVFTALVVTATVVLGTLVAYLLAHLGPVLRALLTAGLVLAWAMPVVVAINVWKWMFDYEFGVLNHLLTNVLHVGDFVQHDWFESPTSGFVIIGALIVWGAIPFVAITVYAGLSQLPQELVEAAELDGASPLRVFRDVTLPILKPIFVIVTSLSVIWDFQVFVQVWLMRDGRPSEDYWLMSVYSFVESFRISEYGYGAAIALVMVAIMFGATLVWIRQMVKMGEIR